MAKKEETKKKAIKVADLSAKKSVKGGGIALQNPSGMIPRALK